MNKPKTGLTPVFALCVVLVVLGLLVLGNSTDFNPDPVLGDSTNPTGQLAGVVVSATGIVVLAIAAAGSAVCKAVAQRHGVQI